MKTGKSGEGFGRRERVTLPPRNVTHLMNIHNNVTSLVFTQNPLCCYRTSWILGAPIFPFLLAEVSPDIIRRLYACGANSYWKSATSEWLEGGVTPWPPYWEEMWCSLSAFLVPLKAEVTREKSNCSLSDQSPEAEEPQPGAGKHRTKLPGKRFFVRKCTLCKST